MEGKKLMKAILYKDGCKADEMEIGSIEKPVPNPNQILVKVKAAGVNRADIMQREGKYPPPEGITDILGLEMSGVVEETGSSADKWKKGDKVFGLLPGGGYAEYAALHEDMAMSIPVNLSFAEAASIPEVFLTAFQSIVWITKLKEKEKILIHAGASGVGTAAIQIAKNLGADVYITASRQKHDKCLDLGALQAIDYKSEDFEEKIKEFTNSAGVDVIMDFIGAPYFKKNIDLLKRDGRMVILSTLGGGITDGADLRKILVKRLSIFGSALRSRTREYQIELTRDFSEFALPKFESGVLKPAVDKIYNVKDAAEAHLYMESNRNTGKIVLDYEGL